MIELCYATYSTQCTYSDVKQFGDIMHLIQSYHTMLQFIVFVGIQTKTKHTNTKEKKKKNKIKLNKITYTNIWKEYTQHCDDSNMLSNAVLHITEINSVPQIWKKFKTITNTLSEVVREIKKRHDQTKKKKNIIFHKHRPQSY